MMVFLDIGSTLLGGPSQGPVQRLRAMLSLGPEHTAAIAQTIFTTPYANADELSERLAAGLRITASTVLEAVKPLWENQLEETYPLPGAQSIVAALEDAKIPCAYLSNIWPPFFVGFTRYFPNAAHHSPCYLSFRIGRTKPDPAFFQHALTDLGVAPGECIMIGDTYQDDIAPAMALGLKSVWVLHRPDKERQDIVRVLNGTVPTPTLTLASIGDLRVDQLRSTGQPRSRRH